MQLLFTTNSSRFYLLQTERDGLIQQREELNRRLESNECLLKEKEDEVFLQLERVVYLEEQCDKVTWFFFVVFMLERTTLNWTNAHTALKLACLYVLLFFLARGVAHVVFT